MNRYQITFTSGGRMTIPAKDEIAAMIRVQEIHSLNRREPRPVIASIKKIEENIRRK